jgi:hypothetical protein
MKRKQKGERPVRRQKNDVAPWWQWRGKGIGKRNKLEKTLGKQIQIVWETKWVEMALK